MTKNQMKAYIRYVTDFPETHEVDSYPVCFNEWLDWEGSKLNHNPNNFKTCEICGNYYPGEKCPECKGDYDYMKNEEEYLFKIARRVLEWVEADYTEEELADLVMGELLDIKNYNRRGSK